MPTGTLLTTHDAAKASSMAHLSRSVRLAGPSSAALGRAWFSFSLCSALHWSRLQLRGQLRAV